MSSIADFLAQLNEGRALSRDQARDCLTQVIEGQATDTQIEQLLTAYYSGKVSVEELIGFREVLLSRADRIDFETQAAIDLCGTGGDGKGTINISTISAFVVSALGLDVLKHGNYGASSGVGSSTILEALGLPLISNKESLRRLFDRTRIVFLHAPFWHPSLKSLAPIRKKLGFRTIFNLLGPLVNPAAPVFQLIGVPNPEQQQLLSAVMSESDAYYGIVTSAGGYDEVSLTGPATLVSRDRSKTLSPLDFGAEAVRPSDLLHGGTVASAKEITEKILRGKGSAEQHSVIAANAALGLHIARPSQDLKECYRLALDCIKAGAAYEKLQELRRGAGHVAA